MFLSFRENSVIKIILYVWGKNPNFKEECRLKEEILYILRAKQTQLILQPTGFYTDTLPFTSRHVITCVFCRRYLWMGRCLQSQVWSLEAPVPCGPKLVAGMRRTWCSWWNARTSWQQSCVWVNTKFQIKYHSFCEFPALSTHFHHDFDWSMLVKCPRLQTYYGFFFSHSVLV